MNGERFDHVGLSVENLDAMQAWYERALGFTSEFAFAPMPDLRIAMLLHPSGARLELFERSGSNESPIPPDPLSAPSHRGLTHWSLCVDDLDATMNGSCAPAPRACGGRDLLEADASWRSSPTRKGTDRAARAHTPDSLRQARARGARQSGRDGVHRDAELADVVRERC